MSYIGKVTTLIVLAGVSAAAYAQNQRVIRDRRVTFYACGTSTVDAGTYKAASHVVCRGVVNAPPRQVLAVATGDQKIEWFGFVSGKVSRGSNGFVKTTHTVSQLDENFRCLGAVPQVNFIEVSSAVPEAGSLAGTTMISGTTPSGIKFSAKLSPVLSTAK